MTPLALVANDALPNTGKSYVSINNGLLSYSRRWNTEFVKMERASDEVVKQANSLNAQTANFNNSIFGMYADLQSILNYIYAGGLQ